jgi:hypothetical protein
LQESQAVFTNLLKYAHIRLCPVPFFEASLALFFIYYFHEMLFTRKNFSKVTNFKIDYYVKKYLFRLLRPASYVVYGHGLSLPVSHHLLDKKYGKSMHKLWFERAIRFIFL